VLVSGARVFGRAVSEAYKQAAASHKYQAYQAKTNPTAAKTVSASGMTLDEACRILNVKQPQAGEGNLEEVMSRFKRLFDVNEPANGGSFYLQSKILRARERIEIEFKEAESAQEERTPPKMYKDR
jgi:import inner membrane translocase subunit TIM16